MLQPRFVTRIAESARSPAEIAYASRELFARAGNISVISASVAGQGVLRGAFEANRRGELRCYRRASGGRSVLLQDGALYFALFLPGPAAASADTHVGNLFNRLLRPMLKALTGEGAQAHYFGRDWIAVDKRPAITVAFAHERSSGRTLVEVFLGVSSSIAVEPEHPAYLGKAVGSIESIVQRPLPVDQLTQRIAHAYAVAYNFEWRDGSWPEGEAEVLGNEAPWQHTLHEPIGLLGARRDEAGALTLGGELMISHDVLPGLANWLGSAESEDDIDEAIATCLGAPNVALFGIQSGLSFKRLLLGPR